MLFNLFNSAPASSTIPIEELTALRGQVQDMHKSQAVIEQTAGTAMSLVSQLNRLMGAVNVYVIAPPAVMPVRKRA